MSTKIAQIAGFLLFIHLSNEAASQLKHPGSQLKHPGIQLNQGNGDMYRISNLTNIPRQQDITWPLDKTKLHNYLNHLYAKIQVNAKAKVETKKQLYDRIARIMTKVGSYDPCFNFEVQFKGSTYEGLKIGQPDEFDFGLVNNYWTGKVVFGPGTPPLPGFGFAMEQLKVYNCFDNLKQAGTTKIDPVKIRGYLRTLVERAMKELGMGRDVLWEQGPAVSFEYPSGNLNFPFISVDLAIAIDLVNWPTVARQLPDEFTKAKAQLVPKPVDNRPMLWQISFSQVEKKIMDNIDNDLGCRKKILMLAKYLKGSTPGKWNPLSSYHLKMVLFNLNEDRKNPKDWAPSMLVPRFQEFIERLLWDVKEGWLPSYFIPAYNLLENKPGLAAAKEGILNAMRNLPGT